MREQELEKWIMKILQEESDNRKLVLTEQWDFSVADLTGDKISKTFIDPWVDVLKVIGYELTGVVADVVLEEQEPP